MVDAFKMFVEKPIIDVSQGSKHESALNNQKQIRRCILLRTWKEVVSKKVEVSNSIIDMIYIYFFFSWVIGNAYGSFPVFCLEVDVL